MPSSLCVIQFSMPRTFLLRPPLPIRSNAISMAAQSAGRLSMIRLSFLLATNAPHFVTSSSEVARGWADGHQPTYLAQDRGLSHLRAPTTAATVPAGANRSRRGHDPRHQPRHGRSLGSSALFSLAGPIPTGSNPTVAFSKPDIENYDSAMGRLTFHSERKTKSRVATNSIALPKLPCSIRWSWWPTLTLPSISVAQNALIHETHVFSPILINDFRASYSREVSHRGPDRKPRTSRPSAFPFPSSPHPPPFRASAFKTASPSATTHPPFHPK